MAKKIVEKKVETVTTDLGFDVEKAVVAEEKFPHVYVDGVRIDVDYDKYDYEFPMVNDVVARGEAFRKRISATKAEFDGEMIMESYRVTACLCWSAVYRWEK
jgi:hypothetical protein